MCSWVVGGDEDNNDAVDVEDMIWEYDMVGSMHANSKKLPRWVSENLIADPWIEKTGWLKGML